VTLESLVYGTTRGLALAAVLLILATFSAAVDPYRLVRAAPRFLHRSAVALSIALTFVPQTLAAQREIREAMALRGHRFRGLRDLVPLFVALVAGGLERSIDLAEAMEARGFGAAARPAVGARANRPAGGVRAVEPAGGDERALPPAGGGERAAARPAGGGEWATRPAGGAERAARLGPRTLEAAIAGGLALAVAGVYGRSAWPGSPLAGRLGAAAIILGVLLVAGALAAVGRSVRATRYRPERWARRDTVVAAASAVALAAFAAAWIWRRGELLFYPYPRLEAPGLSPWLAAALTLLAVPAVAAWIDDGGAPVAGGGEPPAPAPATRARSGSGPASGESPVPDPAAPSPPGPGASASGGGTAP
jgi:energy-coupling factor transport system permease protein